MNSDLPGRFILPSGALDFPETRGFPGSGNFVSKSKLRYLLTMLQNYMKIHKYFCVSFDDLKLLSSSI